MTPAELLQAAEDDERRFKEIDYQQVVLEDRLSPTRYDHWTVRDNTERHLRRMAANWKAMAKDYRWRLLTLHRALASRGRK